MKSFLWLLVMTAGLALMIWLVPPREIEASVVAFARTSGATRRSLAGRVLGARLAAALCPCQMRARGSRAQHPAMPPPPSKGRPATCVALC